MTMELGEERSPEKRHYLAKGVLQASSVTPNEKGQEGVGGPDRRDGHQ